MAENKSSGRQQQSSPFTARFSQKCDNLVALLPATYRTASDNLAAPASCTAASIRQELNLSRLSQIHQWLWLAGRPMPPRPLHYQLILNRDIFITERMEMHLVWTTGRIFLKPLPRFLLEPDFWSQFLCCEPLCECSFANVNASFLALGKCNRKQLYETALGFLFSYAALISHECDFQIALQRSLLPPTMKWSTWRTIVEELNTEYIYPHIDRRFYYGELRLNRLNKIHYLWQTPLYNYMSRWNQYTTFFSDNFTWLASATVYIAVVLSAMQVGNSLETLKDNQAFQSASYGFTILSILGPLACIGIILLGFCYVFIQSWIVTIRYKRRRLQCIAMSKERS